MKTKNRHSWINEHYYSHCSKCDLRKRMKKRKDLIADGLYKDYYSIEYFTSDGELVQNSGCIDVKQLTLF